MDISFIFVRWRMYVSFMFHVNNTNIYYTMCGLMLDTGMGTVLPYQTHSQLSTKKMCFYVFFQRFLLESGHNFFVPCYITYVCKFNVKWVEREMIRSISLFRGTKSYFAFTHRRVQFCIFSLLTMTLPLSL